MGQGLELWRDDLLGLPHDLDEVSRELGLVRGQEGVRGSLCSSSSGTSNAVDVVLDGSWETEVDDNSNVLDIYNKGIRANTTSV